MHLSEESLSFIICWLINVCIRIVQDRLCLITNDLIGRLLWCNDRRRWNLIYKARVLLEFVICRINQLRHAAQACLRVLMCQKWLLTKLTLLEVLLKWLHLAVWQMKLNLLLDLLLDLLLYLNLHLLLDLNLHLGLNLSGDNVLKLWLEFDLILSCHHFRLFNLLDHLVFDLILCHNAEFLVEHLEPGKAILVMVGHTLVALFFIGEFFAEGLINLIKLAFQLDHRFSHSLLQSRLNIRLQTWTKLLLYELLESSRCHIISVRFCFVSHPID